MDMSRRLMASSRSRVSDSSSDEELANGACVVFARLPDIIVYDVARCANSKCVMMG